MKGPQQRPRLGFPIGGRTARNQLQEALMLKVQNSLPATRGANVSPGQRVTRFAHPYSKLDQQG
jgi:hypothetical protein